MPSPYSEAVDRLKRACAAVDEARTRLRDADDELQKACDAYLAQRSDRTGPAFPFAHGKAPLPRGAASAEPVAGGGTEESGLTRRERILRYLRVTAHGDWKSLESIVAGIGDDAADNVSPALSRLRRAGLVERDDEEGRGWRIAPKVTE